MFHRLCRNHPTTQLWRLVCTAQRHKGGARRAGDSRAAMYTKLRERAQHMPSLTVPSDGACTELDSIPTLSLLYFPHQQI